MKKQVIENFNEWIFEAEAAASGSPLIAVLKKVDEIFPKAEWYKKVENAEIKASDPEAVKAFKVVNRFFDSKVPELAKNMGKDFYEYYVVKGKQLTDKPADKQPIIASHNDIMRTKNLRDAIVPVLQSSYATGSSTVAPFSVAAERAAKSAPMVSKLLTSPEVKPHVQTLYTELTKTA